MVFDIDEILYPAWKEASKGKHNQQNQAKYEFYLTENLYALQKALVDDTYKPAPLRVKRITIPKKRIAQVPSLEDKIVQHAICDNYAYDRLTKPLIKETCACIKGRGTDYARNLLKQQLSAFYREYGVKPYILKVDIKSYFASIPHWRIIKLIDRYIDDEDVKRIMLKFVHLTRIGLPLGLQQSQLLANLYLSGLDHYLKEQCGCKYYGRYMDDFYVMSDNKEFLEDIWKKIEDYVISIGLDLNPKTRIQYNRIEHLGFVFKLTDTGKVIVTLNNQKKLTQRHRVRLLVKQLVSGEKTTEDVCNSYNGWRHHALKGNTRSVVLAMDKALSEALKPYGYRVYVGEKGLIKICQDQYRK